MQPWEIGETVFLDFEFMAQPGERPRPVCFVAYECGSDRWIRQWLEDGELKEPPFAHGPDDAMVAYYASAELGCYKALGWKLPRRVIDLYAEFRIATNGLQTFSGAGLLGALQWFGHGDEGSAVVKDTMRARVQQGPPFSDVERIAILDYCERDVRALLQLKSDLLTPVENLVPALIRGDYMKVMAEAEWAGVPVDRELYLRMEEHWPELQARAIERVNEIIPVYENGHFRMSRFEEYLASRGWLDNWPRTEEDALSLEDETFRDQAGLHPELEPLRQVRQMMGQMKKLQLAIGADGRNRCLLSAFRTKTGRNAPSNSKFIFGGPSYMRGLIRPDPGDALAYVDWQAQEFGIAAALSGDTNMQSAYRTGDCYMAFAKLAGAAPEQATKQTHPEIRQLYKSVVLGTQYTISAMGLAYRLEIPLGQAEELLDHHHRVFPQFWRWSDAVVDYAQIYGELTAAFGWRIQISSSTKIRTLRNWPMQSNGSEMLRLAVIYAANDGVQVLAPVHDALLIQASAEDIEDAVTSTRIAMTRASENVLSGFRLQTDATVIRYPDRFEDERGRGMWSWLTEALAA